MDELMNALKDLLGTGNASEKLTILQIVARAFATYGAALVLLRVGENRFLGKSTTFDVILAFLLGSMLSRAVNGSAPVGATLAGAAFLIGLHWALSALSWHSHRVGRLLKGTEYRLVSGGRIDWKQMHRNHITEHDLLEGVRQAAKANALDAVEEAFLERNGRITVVKRSTGPRVIEVRVEDGVQVVRLEIAS